LACIHRYGYGYAGVFVSPGRFMLSVLLIILPIFALIAAGWAARRLGALGPDATRELNRFVVYLALPALLFDIVAKAHWSAIWQPGFIATFGLGGMVVFGVTVLLRMRGGRHLADAAVDGLNASYANTGFIGFPLAASVLGAQALAPTLIATIVTVCVLFAVALVMIEIGLQTEVHPRHMAAKVLTSLARNPLLVAPLLGGAFLASGIATPVPLERFVTLLGGAASPAALVALGLFLAERREGARPASATVGLLVAFKLIAQPALTWALATRVFHLSPALTDAAVLMAALPTGTGPFMVAEFYDREAGITSRVVLISTILSLATITIYLSLR
jgi:predicted permease